MIQDLKRSRIRRKLFAAGNFGCLTLLSPLGARAALITWNGPQDIAGDADVSQNGTLLGALNLDGSGAAVNGVNFQGVDLAFGSQVLTVGNFDLSGFFYNDVGVSFNSGSTAAPFASLGSDYRAMLGTAASAVPSGAAALTLTMNGLTIGQNYEFQAWVNHSNGNVNPIIGTYKVTIAAGNSVELDPNTTELYGGLGQFVIGSFIADATSQQVTFDNAEVARVNGFQLRLTNASVPAPAPFALLIAGATGIFFSGRHPKARRAD